MRNLFLIVAILGAAPAFAKAPGLPLYSAHVSSFCDRSGWDGNYKLIITQQTSEASLLSSGTTEHSVSFDSREDCEAAGKVALDGLDKPLVICGCGAAQTLAEIPETHYAYINCTRSIPNQPIEELVKDKDVVRNDYNTFVDTSKEPGYYFDKVRTGENYQLCKNKVLPELLQILSPAQK